MLKKLIIILIALAIPTAIAVTSGKTDTTKKTPVINIPEITKYTSVDKTFTFSSTKNLFPFKGEVTEDLKDRFIEAVMLSSGKRFYIYFDSPGGSVFALSQILDTMKGSGKHFIGIARYAASAAFMAFEHCDERFLLPGGVLMAHNASGGIHGDLPKMKSRLRSISRMVNRIDKNIAKIMRIPFKKYKKLINNELWIDISNAKRYNAINGKGYVRCTKGLTKQRVRLVIEQCNWLLGCVTVEKVVSGCPLINKTYNKKKGVEK